MRLFIAAELPEELVWALAETSGALRDAVPGRYVAPDSFHVTLAFLGEVAGSRAGALEGVLERSCAGVPPIEAVLGELGTFGRGRKTALWQGVRTDGALEALAARVRSELDSCGFVYDGKGFLPHVTLIRGADVAGLALPMPCVERGTIDTIALLSSDLSGERPVYTPLIRVALGKLCLRNSL